MRIEGVERDAVAEPPRMSSKSRLPISTSPDGVASGAAHAPAAPAAPPEGPSPAATPATDPSPTPPRPARSPFELLGGTDVVRRIAHSFYDAMERDEPALTAVHALDAEGRIRAETRERFALFFIGWLGGPQDYVERHGHPRLRMRHAHVGIDTPLRDAWMRAMSTALEENGVSGDLRAFLEYRLTEVAEMLRNRPDRAPAP